MSEKERLVRFELMGQEYAFYTGASEEEMESILSLVRSLVKPGPAGASGTLPVSKIAILACLNIASRYVKLKQEFKEYREDSEQRIARLNEKIGAGLAGDDAER
ncbi:cell division protein ZapA [Desulfomarina sp.]